MRHSAYRIIKCMVGWLTVFLLAASWSACEGVQPTSEGGQDPSTSSPATQISDEIRIVGVRVSAEQVILRGKAGFPDGVCLNTELWADGALLTWWPAEECASLQMGSWEFIVDLEPQNMLQPGVQYRARAYRQGEPERLSIFPFDLDGPPMNEP